MPRSPQDPDPDTVVKAVSGDSEAIGEIIVHFQSFFLGVIYGMLGDRDLSFDTYQEASLAFSRAISSFDPSKGTKLVTYFYTFVKRKALDARRKRTSAKHHRPLSEISTEPLDELIEDNGNASHCYETLLRRVERAISRLNETEKEVIDLWWQGASYTEMALKLGVREGTIRMRFVRAKERFVQRLMDDE